MENKFKPGFAQKCDHTCASEEILQDDTLEDFPFNLEDSPEIIYPRVDECILPVQTGEC